MKLTRKQKRALIRIILAAVFFAAALLVKFEPVRIALFLAGYASVGADVLYSAVKGIIRGNVFSEQLLMSVATVGALIIGEFPEAVAVMLFYQVGELFQSVAVGKSRKSIAALMEICPDEARVIRDGEELVISPEEVEIGEIILLRPGDKIPLDGIVAEGEGSVDNSALTGESLPVEIRVGDKAISGGVNLDGVLKIKVEKSFEESTVSKILELVENSAAKKSKVEKFISRFALFYTPAVVAAALLISIFPPIITRGDFIPWIERGLMFLVMSCPCAVVISVPLSFFSGIGAASREGILVKGAEYMERLSKVNTFVFDKTGTLTKGKFKVSGIYPAVDEELLIKTAAIAERYSTHPIAECIKELWRGETPEFTVKNLAGFGISAKIDGVECLVGNERLLKSAGVIFESADNKGIPVYVSRGSEYLGFIEIEDEIKCDAKDCVKAIKSEGIKSTVMLSGDKNRIAQSVGKMVGIDEVKAELLPEEKVAEVERLKAAGGIVCYVGDGINDAPSLALSDVGIAMGGLGSDAAIESADIVIMDDKLMSLTKGVRISKRTLRIAYQNVIFSLGVKFAVLLFGALVGPNMWLAVFADVGVMVLAILNSMRNFKRVK